MKSRISYICLQSRKEGTPGFTHVTEIIRGLKKRDWHVDLYEPGYGHAFQDPKAFERLLNFLRVQIRFFMNATPIPDAAYLRSHFALLPVTLFCKLKGIPVIQEINGPFEDLFIAWPLTKKLSWLFNFLSKIQYRLSDAAVAVTPNLGDWFIRQAGVKPVFIIPNGANTDIFHPKAVSKLDLPQPYVFFFGTLAKWQGIDTILAAANHPCWPDGLNLVLAGDGVERQKVENYCNQNDHAVWLRKVPYTRIPGVIANSMVGLSTKCDVQAHAKTGLYPLKLFETLACGVPIIVTDFPGQADLVNEHGCGLVIEPNNPEVLAKAVSYLYHHPDERNSMGVNGKNAIQRGHSWDKRAADTDKAIRTLID
jgi:glycosyltransferase involved in cell wall biosynthesis